jgi:hypothetical protein
MTTPNFNSFIEIETPPIHIPDARFVHGVAGDLLCAAYSKEPLPKIVLSVLIQLLAKKIFHLSLHQLTPKGLLELKPSGVNFSDPKKNFQQKEALIDATMNNDFRDYVTILFTTEDVSEINYLNKIYFIVNLKNENWGIKLKEFIDGRF